MKINKVEYTSFKFNINGDEAILDKDITIKVVLENKCIYYSLKKGFRWNGCSFPTPICPRFDKKNELYNIAILLHDVNYHNIGVKKDDSDEMLCQMLRKSGYNAFNAELIHIAVRLFGKTYGEDEFNNINNGLIRGVVERKVC